MEKYHFDDHSQIFLFKSIIDLKHPPMAINEFLAYLKYCRVMGPYKFSFVGPGENLIPDLTLKQNIMIDYTNASLSEDKEIHFKSKLKERPNIYLEALYHKILNINDIPANATKEELKLVGLIKALISESPFIFLENPELDLAEDTFKLFQDALKIQIELSGQNVFIQTYQIEKWSNLVDKVVSRNKDYSFNTKDHNHDSEFEKLKKEFYQSEEEANQSHLQFKFPKKKSA